MDTSYNSKEVEKKIHSFWKEQDVFATDENLKNKKKTFSIVIPPPNVTGVLHIGHALNTTLQDILCRYKKLKGYDVLWVPGTDHAGIATQNVVERKLLSEENLRKEDIGKKKFLEKVLEWKEQSGGTIIKQFKSLGASCDWEKERFTMDEGLSKAVKKAFVELYNKGLIYRANYIINWCPRCQTALADDEVEHKENNGYLYYIKYPIVDSDEFLVVATTRPETMFGDSAIAINPKDKRYKNLKPKSYAIIPIIGRKIPIIKDKYVDVDFGTGALKITPAHDFNDFEIGKKHDLAEIKAFDEKGVMTKEAGEFENIDRFECRKKLLKVLKEKDILLKQEEYVNNVGHCYRCATVIEPYISVQWFIKIKPLAKKAIKAVKDEKIKIIPEYWKKTYFEWMNNIRDWCISRQIWWGHRIPAWFCRDCGNIIVSEETIVECKCGSKNLKEEEDVLDTWFSSALWPFSTMGWPEKTPLLKKYYPTSVLVTSFDIIFFWVARMIMMGLELTNKIPFHDVHLHAIVRDEKGKKMSKSTGNVIDPLKLIDKFGTDSLRITFAAFAAQGRDIKMSEKRVEGYRHFINKIWNASRFALTHIDENTKDNFNKEDIKFEDRWILSELSKLSKGVSHKIDTYKFNEAASLLYQFVWHKFCDWYLEMIKPSLYGKKGEENRTVSKSVLYKVLKDTLILLHPFIPFITEEIYLKLNLKETITKEEYPSLDFYDKKVENDMTFLMDIVTGIRNVRSEKNISVSKKISIHINAEKDTKKEQIVTDNRDLIEELTNSKLCDDTNIDTAPDDKNASFSINNVFVFILLDDVVDFEEEKKKKSLKLNKINKELEKIEGSLKNENFLKKAPEEIIKKKKKQVSELKNQREEILNYLSKI